MRDSIGPWARLLVLACSIFLAAGAAAESYVATEGGPGRFPLAVDGMPVPLFLSPGEFPGVLRVAGQLRSDLERVTGTAPRLETDREPAATAAVLIGTIGKNPVIDRLIAVGKIDAAAVAGRRDTFALQTVDDPLPGVDEALVIFGSDKRGTIYGMYDLAKEIGVSPWYWWADVPVEVHRSLYVEPGAHSAGEPKVKYRGIFINDEAPALRGWAEEKFGGFNHDFYAKVYELILRLKGNYLWPAMWLPSAFYVDDPESARLADEMGIVIATSHHEPMMRAHAEWKREQYGDWNYETNAGALRAFWRGGIERMGDYESVVTVGMRGDGDEAMSDETAVGLLSRIVSDQREILSEVTGRPAKETPQVWALYKEVQDYYDKGMRVPDDVTLLLCDDNWGNVRVLPRREDRGREGGFGMYYHFDFVGGPVSYRWLNVTQIEKVWEQMNLSYEWGVRDLWLVNVGDIKPMELPVSFFLDLAWNPEAIDAEDLPGYYLRWARQQFGDRHALEIAGILAGYTKYNARRTPEMLAPDTYSLANYREADTVVADYRRLADKARRLYAGLPEEYRAAFYQLVLFPVEISSNLNAMYVAAGKNRWYANQGRASANRYADEVEVRFEKDAELTRCYHEELAGGKWNHMMSQTHIGYTSWDNPPENRMPAVSRVRPGKAAGLGIALEQGTRAALPTFDPVNDQRYAIEVFNTGQDVLEYSVQADADWIELSSAGASIRYDDKVFVGIDWDRVPRGQMTGKVTVSGAGKRHVVEVRARTDVPEVTGFAENDGVVSIEASEYTNAIAAGDVRWTVIPNLGRTGSSVTVEPADAETRVPGDDTPRLEYAFTVFDESRLVVETYLSPTLNFQKNEGLKFAIAIDDQPPRIVNIHEGDEIPDWEYPDWWNDSVTDHVRKKRTRHGTVGPGAHTLKIWMVDPGVVFQKFVIDAGGLKPSYLGPPAAAAPPKPSSSS